MRALGRGQVTAIKMDQRNGSCYMFVVKPPIFLEINHFDPYPVHKLSLDSKGPVPSSCSRSQTCLRQSRSLEVHQLQQMVLAPGRPLPEHCWAQIDIDGLLRL